MNTVSLLTGFVNDDGQLNERSSKKKHNKGNEQATAVALDRFSPVSTASSAKRKLNFAILDSDFMKEIEEPTRTYHAIPTISMDKYYVNDDQEEIGISGLSSCIGLFFKGLISNGTSEGKTALGAFHYPRGFAPEKCIMKMRNKMQELGCKPKDIEIYAVGGIHRLSSDITDRIVELAKEYGIKGYMLNTCKEGESLQAVMTKDGLLFAKDTAKNLLIDVGEDEDLESGSFLFSENTNSNSTTSGISTQYSETIVPPRPILTHSDVEQKLPLSEFEQFKRDLIREITGT